MTKTTNFLFTDELPELDQDVNSLVEAEEQRHQLKLVMIPSESLCPQAVRQALATVFSNKYAEGYPSLRMTIDERARVAKDLPDGKAGRERYLAFHRRYGDRRFYKGAEYGNFIEVLAQHRAAEIFANEQVPAEKIFVNVQSLSGAAANNAVYNAFLLPGDTVMGMSLSYGGHLTHGSPFNRSGRQYQVIPYIVDMKTGRLDYDQIKQLAQEHKPKIIIAGASAYPWDIDWSKLREIADSVPVQIPGLTKPGAILLADIAHPVGLVVAGLFPNPIGYADVITMTTHKTLCGPRGAIILSTNETIARQIDLGVFPGEQGGPHLNQIAAKAVCFKLAAAPEFKELQKRIVENCQALAGALQKLGLKLAYGGTNTHMLLIDLNGVKTESGVPLKGDITSNILDICGITCNKNALPGDETGARPRGIRFGTTILTQRGMGKQEMSKIAQLIHKVITNIRTFKVIGTTGELFRGKIPLEVIEEVKKEVKQLLKGFPIRDVISELRTCLAVRQALNSELIEIIGECATAFLQGVVTGDIFALKPEDGFQTILLDAKGNQIDEVTIQRLKDTATGYQHYLVTTHPDKTEKIMTWLTGLSDGYILFDEDDIYAKIDGPVVIRRSASGAMRSASKPKTHDAKPTTHALTKPYFIGQRILLNKKPRTPTPKGEAIANSKLQTPFKHIPYEGEPRKTYLYEEHLKQTKKQFMVSFAGWSMPVWYSRVSEEHQAVRQTAGLFDVSHMGRLEIKGVYATRFLDLVTTNYVPKLKTGQAHYSYILDPDGNVMDDIFLYCLARDHYIMVVNAVNAEKIKQWLDAVNEKKVSIDKDCPDREIEGKVTITDLRDPANGSAQLVNVALQGPNSLKILQCLNNNRVVQEGLRNLKKSHFAEFDLSGIKSLVARTGYTGEEIGFEILVKPGDAPKFWNLLLKQGKEFGLKPCGLAARDSTRTEAGFPLYGHELSGPHNVTPTEAGYGSFIKRHKSFFIGRNEYLKKEAGLKNILVRFQITQSGARVIKNGNPVVDRKGEYIGVVTSCSLAPTISGQAGGIQTGLAYVACGYKKEGTRLGIFVLPKDDKKIAVKSPRNLTSGDKVVLTEEAVVVSRFPLRDATTTPT